MKSWLIVIALVACPTWALAEDEAPKSQTDVLEGKDSDDDEDDDDGERRKPKPSGEGKTKDGETQDTPPTDRKKPRTKDGKPASTPAPAPAVPPAPAYAPEPEPPGPPISRLDALLAAPPPPLHIDLPHGFWIEPEASVQIWTTIFDMDDDARNNPVVVGDPDHREGFSIRRARLGLTAGFDDLARLRISAGWQDRYDALSPRPTTPRLVEASLWFTPIRFVGIGAGYTRVPFGRQQMNGSMDLALFERAMLSEVIAPAREPGLVVRGAIGPLGGAGLIPEELVVYELGVSNGDPDFTGDLDPEPRLTGRLQINLFEAWQGRESRFSEASPVALSIGGGVMHNRALEANTTTVGADLGVHVWRIQLQGEFAWRKAVPTFDPAGVPELLTARASLGWYGQLVFAVVPDWFEVAFRVDGLDDNTAIKDAGDRLDVTGGVNVLFLRGRLKLQLDYIHREELLDAAKTANDSLMMVLQARL